MEQFNQKQLENQAERVKSDAGLIKEGAKYVNDEGNKEPRLEVSKASIEDIEKNFGKSIEYIQNKYQDSPGEREKLTELIKKLQTLGAHRHMRIELRSEKDSESNYSYAQLVDDKLQILLYPGKMYLMELDDIEDIELSGSGLQLKVKEGVIGKIKKYREGSYGTGVQNRNPHR